MGELGTYLGDGVYASHDGYQIWLRTERENVWQVIALEPVVFAALVAYEARIVEEAQAALKERYGDGA